MPVKYRNIVSLVFVLPIIILLLSSPAYAANWFGNGNTECQQSTVSQKAHTKWQSFFHFKRYWFGSHHCASNNNLKPTAKAGPNLVINATETVSLNGSESSDSDGTIASYKWTLVNKNWWPFHQHDHGELLDQQSAIASFVAPSSFRTQYFIFRLQVIDNDGAKSTDYVRVKVLPVPNVSIEGGNDFESGQEIELITKQRKQYPNASYSWSQLSGSTATFISANNEQNALIKLPNVSETDTLVFEVAVQYGNKRPIYAVKTITVSEPALQTSHISGRILSVIGMPIANVDITALDNSGLNDTVTAQSDSNGEFNLTLTAQTNYVLQLTDPSASIQVIPITSPSANNTFSFNDLVMISRGAVEPISSNGEQTIASKDGASVSFDKANFVDADGQPLNGDMQLTITTVDVSNTRSIKAFPGLFLGVDDDSLTPEIIVSLGLVEFHFTHNGEAVNLASGATADVLIPIYVNEYPNGQAIEVGQTTPLRSLNETTGIWTQEGMGTVVYSDDSPTGLAYQATVSHFSWWGSDVAIATPAGDTTPNTGMAYVTVNVSGPAGFTGVAVVEATAPGLVNWRGSSVSTAVDIGSSTPLLTIPANRDVCFSAYIYFSSGGIAQTNSVCQNLSSESTVNLNITLGAVGPIDVTVTPQTSDDAAVIQGFINIQSPAVRIAPLTIETTINYQVVSGALPLGLSLVIFDNGLNLVGIPITLGTTSFVIRATDADGYTDDINVSYNVSLINPPPIIGSDNDRFFTGEITTPGGTAQVNLNDLVTNSGGPISEWREVTSVADQTECLDMYASAGIKGASADLLLPASVTLNQFSGELSFSSPEYWLSCMMAYNSQGTSVFLFGFEISDTSAAP